jgi:outer membrane protein
MRKTLLTLALLVPAMLPAQDLRHPWTLVECLDWALEHSLTVKQSEISLRQKEIQLNTSENSWLPQVNASVNESISFGRGLTADNTYTSANTTSTSFSIGAGMNLFDGLATPNNIALARLNLEAATADLERARDDIRVAVARAYVQVLYDYEIVDVARKQIELDDAQVSRLEALAATGKAAQAEVSQQKASRAQSGVTLVQAENNLRLALLDLGQLLEFSSVEGFSIERPEVQIDQILLDMPERIYADAVETRPAVLAEQIRLKGTEKSLKVAQAAQYPTLSLSGGVGTNYYTTNNAAYPQDKFWNQLSHNFSPYIGVSLNIPIFMRFQTRNNIRTARLNQELQQIQLDKTRQSLYKEIQQAWSNAVAAEAKYRSSSEAATAAEDAFRLVQAKYENGKATITEFNESRNQLLKTQSDRVQATYEYLFQSKLLDFYRGSALTM